jgi:TAP-like protein
VQLFARTAPLAVRARQYRAALHREPAPTFAPFTLRQWTSLDQYTEAYTGCLRWPTPARLIPPIVGRPPLVPPRLPVLILSGTLDSLTPKLRGATLVAQQMGPWARLVTVAGRRARQAAAAALASAGDELSRWPLLGGNRDRGLRGGAVRFISGPGLLRVALHDVRWVGGARTDGTARLDESLGLVTAHLAVRYGAGATVRLTARWLLFGAQDQPAVIHGRAGTRRLAATLPAP